MERTFSPHIRMKTRVRSFSDRARPRGRIGALAGVLVLLLAASACSHKSPVAVDGGGGGTPELFFNWLPALLVDQESAQPNHEIMEWLDDPANYPRQDRLADLRTILERLGNAPQEYRAHAPGYSPVDEPILSGIEAYIEQAQAYLNGNYTFQTLLQRNPN